MIEPTQRLALRVDRAFAQPACGRRIAPGCEPLLGKKGVSHPAQRTGHSAVTAHRPQAVSAARSGRRGCGWTQTRHSSNSLQLKEKSSGRWQGAARLAPWRYPPPGLMAGVAQMVQWMSNKHSENSRQ